VVVRDVTRDDVTDDVTSRHSAGGHQRTDREDETLVLFMFRRIWAAMGGQLGACPLPMKNFGLLGRRGFL